MRTDKRTLAFMAVAVTVSLVLAGCTGQPKTSQSSGADEQLPVHPNAESPELPEKVMKTIKDSLSEDAKVNAYVIGKTSQEVLDWYSNKLSKEGYSEEANVESRGNTVVLWKKKDLGVFINIQTQNGNTNAIVVQDDWQDLKHIKEGAAQAS